MSTRHPFAYPGASARRNKLWFGLLSGVLLITLFGTMVGGGVIYVYQFRLSVEHSKELLLRESAERTMLDCLPFRDAVHHQALLKPILLERLMRPASAAELARFDLLAEVRQDGAVRNRLKLPDGTAYDGRKSAGIFVPKGVPLTDSLKRRVVIFAELCEVYGPAYRAGLENLYLDTPEGAGMIYWPEKPDWCETVPADFDQNAEPYELAANVRNNPMRESRWTDLYFDPGAKAWMISCVTPVDLDGRQVATIGQDFTLTDFLVRFREGSAGVEAVLVRDTGRLISPPKGVLPGAGNAHWTVEGHGDPALREAFRLAQESGHGRFVFDLPAHNRVAAVVWVPELSAYHIRSIPRSAMLNEAARGLALFLLIISLVLAAQVAALMYLVRRHVVTPIFMLLEATRRIAKNDLTRRAPVLRDDEIGELACAINDMRDNIRAREARLTDHAAELEKHVERRTEELRASNRAAEEANRAKGDFMASLSHDIRTPLNSVLGFSQMMADDVSLPAAHVRRVENIRRAGQSILELVDDVIDLARMDSGQFALQPGPVELRRFWDDIVDWVETRCAEKHLELHAVIPEEAPARLAFDADRVRRILHILLGNAVKFTPKGGVTLRLGCDLTPDGDHRLAFTVDDMGPGVPPESRAKVFTRFARNASGGVILGLALARELARKMSGDVVCTDSPDGGARFIFTLAARPVTRVSSRTSAEASESLHLAHAARPPRVLIVDDLAENRELLRAELRRMGVTDCLEASDGDMAWGLLTSQPVDILLSDLCMPTFDGYALVRRLRADEALSTLPAIALSADMADRDGARALAAGFDAFLLKPCSSSALRKCLERQLKRGGGTPAVASVPGAAEVPVARRVLVVDDDEMTREMISALLAQKGHDSDSVGGGYAALEALELKTYDLVMMDMHMPDLDGIGVLRALRERGGAVPPIVCVSGLVSDHERAQFEALGVADFLLKPFRAAELDAMVMRLTSPLDSSLDPSGDI